MLTVASCLPFKRLEGVFGLPDQKMKSNVQTTPQESPLKFEGGSFELIKNFSKILFAGNLGESGPEIHRLVDATEEIFKF